MTANNAFYEEKNEPASPTCSMEMGMRQRTWEIVVAARPDDPTSQRFDVFIMTLIVLNVLVVIIGTVEAVDIRFGAWLWAFEVFSSIPATMWWAVATLTTVGYGDVYPVTMWGKMLASATAILGVGLFALPASILAST